MILAQAITESVTRVGPSVLKLLVVGFLLLGGLALVALLIALVVNRKTRPIGLGVLSVVLLIGGVLLLMLLMPVVTYRSGEQVAVREYPLPRQETQHNPNPSALAEGVTWDDVYNGLIDHDPTSVDVVTETEAEDSTKQPSDDSAAAGDDETDRPKAVEEEPAPPTEPPAKPKPDWVTSPPTRVGNTFRPVIRSDPFTTVDECHKQLDDLLLHATAEYLDQLVDSNYYGRRPDRHLRPLGVTLAYIRSHYCEEDFSETLQFEVGEMKQVCILMKFDEDAQADLRRRWKDSQLEDRLAGVGAVSGGVMLLLGMVFGLFKLDTATKGFYTKRLIFGALAVTMLLSLFAIAMVRLMWNMY